MPFCEHGTGVCCHCQWRRGGAETRAQQHWGQPPHWPVSWHTPSSRWSWSGISSTTRPGTAWVTWAGLWHIASIPCLRKSFRSQLKYDSLQQFGRENKEYTAPDMDGAKFHTLQWDLVDWTEYFRQAVITQKRNVARFTLWVQFWSIKRKYFFKHNVVPHSCENNVWDPEPDRHRRFALQWVIVLCSSAPSSPVSQDRPDLRHAPVFRADCCSSLANFSAD